MIQEPFATFNGHKGPVYSLVAGLADGAFLSGSGDGTVVEWRTDRPDNGNLLVNVGQAIFSLRILPRHQLLFIGTEGGGLHVVDMGSRREQHLFEVHRKGIFAMQELPGERLACAGGDGTISIWSIGQDRNVRLERHFPLAEEKLRALSFDPGDDLLAVGCGDGTIRLLDTALFNERQTMEAHMGTVGGTGTTGTGALAYHPAKPVLLSGGKDGNLCVWRTNDGYDALLALPAHKGGIYRITFAPAGNCFATASRDKTIKLWDANEMKPLQRLDRSVGGHTHSVNAMLWMTDLLITAGDDRRILGWKVE